MPPNLFPGKRGQLPALLAELGEQQGLREDVVLQAGREIDSLGLCALAFGSSGPVTSTCADGKIAAAQG